jgi:hypothetical protein
MAERDLLTLLCEEMAAEDVPDVLAQPVTLAALWADLARLAGEPPPRWVACAVAEAGRERVALTATGRATAWVLVGVGAAVRR